MVQLAGAVGAAQLRLIVLAEVAVAVSPVGADGIELHDAAAVCALACAEGTDVPSASRASTR